MELNPMDQQVRALTSRWWTLVMRGIAAVLFGIFAFAAPKGSLYALVILWGVYALVDGVFALAFAFWRGRRGLRWGWWVFHGVLGLGAGLVTFAWPGITALALVTIIAVWAMLSGIAAITAAVRLRHILSGEWLLATSGVLSVLCGVLLVVYPRSGALAIVWVIGTYAILAGILLTTLGLRLHGWHRDANRGTRAGPAPTAA